MKYLIMYTVVAYIVACADSCEPAPGLKKALRALFWPYTLTVWFSTHNIRLHRMLTILWTVLILGWFLSLLNDKLP